MTTQIQVGQSDTAVVQFFDAAGAAITLDHAVTWSATPSGKVTITPTSNQVATVLAVAAQTGIVLSATDPNQPFTASMSFDVVAVPVPADPLPPPIQPPPPVFPTPNPLPSPIPPPPTAVADDETVNPGPQTEVTGGNGSDGDGFNWWGPQWPADGLPLYPPQTS